MKRIIYVARIERGRWVESKDTHPLPPSARRELERHWPALDTGPEYTAAECERWFAEHFQPERITE